jgi:hypothetical protein
MTIAPLSHDVELVSSDTSCMVLRKNKRRGTRDHGRQPKLCIETSRG